MKLISLLRIATYTAIGIFFGATLGALARGWMRIISDDPEFSWDGTLLIVGIFTVWGFTQGTVIGVRRITSRRWIVTLARVFGSVGLLALFFGAGAVMAPTVIFGGMAIHRKTWKSVARFLLGMIALIPVIVIAVQLNGELGWSWRWLIGIFLFIAIYGSLILASQKTFEKQIDGWRAPRRVKVFLAVGVMLAVALPSTGLGLR